MFISTNLPLQTFELKLYWILFIFIQQQHSAWVKRMFYKKLALFTEAFKYYRQKAVLLIKSALVMFWTDWKWPNKRPSNRTENVARGKLKSIFFCRLVVKINKPVFQFSQWCNFFFFFVKKQWLHTPGTRYWHTVPDFK